MRGAWLSPGAPVCYRDDLLEPAPQEGEVLVEVALAGVCATDLALAQGYMEFEGIPGHEFVGRALSGPLEGQRVVGEINAGCGACGACRGEQGLDARHCASRSVLGILGRHGAFAERLVLPARNLLVVPDSVTDTQAVFCEPLAAAYEILEQVQPVEGTRVLVAGDGRLGLLIAKVLNASGCLVDLAGHHPDRVPTGIGDRTGLLDDARGPLQGERYALAVEATGSPDVLARLMPWVRPKGTLVIKTTTGRPVPIDLTPAVVDELTLLGSRCGPFDVALEALANGRVKVDSLVHATYPLAEIPRAFEQAARSGVLKILIDCQAS